MKNETTHEIHTIAQISVADLPPDLQAVGLLGGNRVAYSVTLVGEPTALSVLVCPDIGRAGVAWGADAKWTDVCAVDPENCCREAVDRFFSGEMVV